MKFLPLKKTTRVNTEDSLGHGMDAVIMLALFLLAGYGLDRWFGTVPVFMIVMTVLGSVGLFFKFKYRYDAKMNQHEAERRGRNATNAASADEHAATPAATKPTANKPAAAKPERAA